MKKVIALVLAVALSLSLASVAFAADVPKVDVKLTNALATEKANPGDDIIIPLEAFQQDAVIGTGASALHKITAPFLSTDYFTIKVEYSRGKELVKEVKFNTESGNEGVKIVLKDDVLAVPSVPNFQIKSITLTGKKDGADKSKETFRGKKYVLEGTDEVGYKQNTPADDKNIIKLNTAVKVGYEEDKVLITDDYFDATIKEKTITKFVNKKDDVPGKDYGVATINFDDKAIAEVRVYKDEKFYLGVKDEADLDIVKANPDAELEFLTFVGKPSFSANAKVEIYADEDRYLYELKDGKLVESSFKYDEDAAAFVGKARTLTAYVISDIKLVNAATAEETKNPDTGANNVVGVAAALAVVSLVAAGAVSLKK